MTSPMTSNVYYLPIPVEEESLVAHRRAWSVLTSRLSSVWWRVRLTVAELRAAFHRAGRHARSLESQAFFDEGDLAERPRALPARPARVIDFSAARLRLRPSRG